MILFFFEAAQKLGERIVAEQTRSTSSRMRYAFKICLSREPNEKELQRLLKFYQQQMSFKKPNLNKSDPVKTTQEQAVWTVVASVLLNLHEFITRD